MRPTVYLDLDRTIFRTIDSKLIWDELAKHHSEAAGAYEKRGDFHSTFGDMYSYDMSSHLQSIGLEPELIFRELIDSPVADGRLQYAGADELVAVLQKKADVKVLTFGYDENQRLRASLCPALRGLDIITTLRPKSEFFAAHPEPSWLIDDKPVGHELPPSVRFIQVSLEGLPFPDDADWPTFTSLYGVKEYFDETLH